MLRVRKDAKKLSENDMNINTTLRSFSVKFMRFKNAIGFLQSPRCKERHEASSKIISEDIASVRQHLADCRAFTADNEALAELLSQHITYVKELITKASRLLGEKQLCPTEETRYYDPARHITAHEVKEIFRKLYPHGKHSARLSIVDITPGRADGEKYTICMTHLGPDPHCSDVLARLCGEPLASSRMVWMGKGIVSKYAIVFDREVVEKLIEAWKAEDPVYDSRAEEAARKKRARARREAQRV